MLEAKFEEEVSDLDNIRIKDPNNPDKEGKDEVTVGAKRPQIKALGSVKDTPMTFDER
jgi:hypothetical protein